MKFKQKIDVVGLKTRLKSYMTIKDLIAHPYPPESYLNLYYRSIPMMHMSLLSRNLSPDDLNWIDTLALQTHISIKNSKPDWSHGYLIFQEISNFINKKSSKKINYFETGTAKGFSVLVAAKAISKHNIGMKLSTVDIIDHETKRYWNSIQDFEGRKNRKELLRNYCELSDKIEFLKFRSNQLSKYVGTENIDIAFLDSAHTYKDLKNEYRFVKNRLNKGGLIIFDDYDKKNYPGVVAFINKLPKNQVLIIHQSNLKSFAIFRNEK